MVSAAVHSPFSCSNPPRSSANANKELEIRELNPGDYHRGFLPLLSQLSEVGDISEVDFCRRFNEQKRLLDTYKIAVVSRHKRLILANNN